MNRGVTDQERIGGVLVRRVPNGDALEFLVAGEPVLRIKMEPQGQSVVIRLEMAPAIKVENIPKKKAGH